MDLVIYTIVTVSIGATVNLFGGARRFNYGYIGSQLFTFSISLDIAVSVSVCV